MVISFLANVFCNTCASWLKILDPPNLKFERGNLGRDAILGKLGTLRGMEAVNEVSSCSSTRVYQLEVNDHDL